MKTTVKIFAALVIAASMCALTACKKDSLGTLTEKSLENTAWKCFKWENYEKEEDKWVLKEQVTFTDFQPHSLTLFKDGYRWGIMIISDKMRYTIDPAKKHLLSEGGSYTIVSLNATDFVLDQESVHISGIYCKTRYYFKKIPPLSLSQLKGRWEITALQKFNDSERKWEDGSFLNGYWIEFGEGGKGKNSRNEKCNYTVNGNIVDIACIYGKSFVMECTADQLVFVHRYKDPYGRFVKETFKRKENHSL